MGGASVAAGIHFRSVMVLVMRSKASLRIVLLGASRVTDPHEKQPEVPHVMLTGAGRGLAATASAWAVNRATVVTTEAKRKSRIMVLAGRSGCVRERWVGKNRRGTRV